MKAEIKYVELKSGFSDDGPAWIGLVSFSKSGRTIYFDGKAFQSLSGNGVSGNYYDIETGEEYWISGVKRDMSDRHRHGSGKVMVEQRIVDDYLNIIRRKDLDKRKFEVVVVTQESPVDRINALENERFDTDEVDERVRFKQPNELTDTELEYFIDYYTEDAIRGEYLKGRKMSRVKMEELVREKIKRAERK